MITQYIEAIMKKARYEILEDDRSIYWSIPWFTWVWANAKTLEKCREELQEILEEWLLIKIRKMKFVPTVKQYDLNEILCHD